MKALIIEDEPHILEDLIEILVSTEAFEKVLSANSKKAAIRILANDAIKLNPIFVTLDLNLCGSRNDGIELLEHFPKGSVVLVYTGMGREYAMDIMNHPHALHLSSKYWEKGERTMASPLNHHPTPGLWISPSAVNWGAYETQRAHHLRPRAMRRAPVHPSLPDPRQRRAGHAGWRCH